MANLPTNAKDAIKALVHDLVLGRFSAIQADGRSGRLSADDLERAVADYGRTLIDLPEDAWSLVDVYAASGMQMSVDVPMWTREEGRSDLTLSASVDLDEVSALISIDDLHVL